MESMARTVVTSVVVARDVGDRPLWEAVAQRATSVVA
jgi:hypothetical protein